MAKRHLSGKVRTSQDGKTYYRTLCKEIRNSSKNYNIDVDEVDCEVCLDIIDIQERLFDYFTKKREPSPHAHEMASAAIRRSLLDSLEPKKKLDPVFDGVLLGDEPRQIVEVHHHYYGGSPE